MGGGGGVTASDLAILLVPLLIIFFVSVKFLGLCGRGDPADAATTAAEQEDVPQGRTMTAAQRMAAGRRRRQAATAAAAAAATEPAAPADGDPEDAEDAAVDDGQDSGLRAQGGKKKAGKKKAANKKAKKELKQYREHERTDREERQEKKLTKYEQREEEREEREREKEEEEARILEEKKEAEQEEYDSWKGMFSTEGAGTVEEEIAEESQGLLTEFIEYIKEHKVVVLSTLATKFGLRTEEAINRVRGLEEMNYISGVFDDRGKFIYISEEEMQKVASWIEKKGRVTVEQLSGESNSLIKLKDVTG